MDELELSLKNVSQEREAIQNAILEGHAMKSHDEYRYHTGRLHGLIMAERIMAEVRKRTLAAQDDDLGEAH